jgi:pSer/pThr/pTyr-binding forkhead associated (FHA) protein/tetratricopeptide (TPR) repeat protein
MHKLLIEDDEGKTVAVPLIREEISIGRLEGNTIRLTEQNVSRKHARLTLRGDQLQIEDLGSYNGTSLNGSTLAGQANLKDGDVIMIGDYRLGIQEERTSQASHVSSGTMPAVSAVVAPAPVDQVMDGQPTIPISTLAVQTAFSEPPARLVIAGRVLSGGEYILDRIAHVVGRTPENDIVLNHKSISRHHAKITREGNRYTILDLESANGVRVGGAERDRVELQSGDIIELGEVRLRFLSGDGAFYDEPVAWYQDKRKAALAAGGGAVALVSVLAWALSGGAAKTPVARDRPAPPPVIQPTAPTVPTPPLLQEPKPAEPPVSIVGLLAEARTAAAAEKWDDALAALTKATAQVPNSTEAADLHKEVEAEKAAHEKLASLKQAMAEKDFGAVLAGVAAIPDGSVYKRQAVDLGKAAQSQFIVVHVAAAKSKLADGDCDEARREADLVLTQDAKNKKAAEVVRRCDILAKKPPVAEPVAMSAKPVRHRAAALAPAPAPVVRAQAVATKPKAAETPKPETTGGVDPEKSIKDAQQAWFRGQYAAAIENARKALRVKPGLTNAYQIIAVCSCALHDADSAAKAFEKLDERNKLYVKSACQKNGISF